MHSVDLIKPDGRELTLYSRRPIPRGLAAPSPRTERVVADPELRWHPLRGEWVAYATHRQDRTFLPPAEYNPLRPMSSGDFPTELPAGDYDVAVFDNLFPTLSLDAVAQPELSVPTRPGRGKCEVVVFTQDPQASLGQLPLERIELILEVWADRERRCRKNPELRYLMAFENRGVEVGVTLHHPHGQIYAYPFVPPVAERELEQQARHLAEKGRGLLESMLESELEEETRVIYRGSEAHAFVPVCARYPYELWVLPARPAPSLSKLGASERAELARALKTSLLKLDGLWKRPLPYLLLLRQAPLDGEAHPEAHVHFQIYPALRSPGRLKYLAGTELGAGLFANDSKPEDKARELQAVE